MRHFSILALAALVAACAAPAANKPTSLNTVYIVGDQSAAAQTAAEPKEVTDDKSAASPLRQLFWPLSGR